jgi:hypothetical protein
MTELDGTADHSPGRWGRRRRAAARHALVAVLASALVATACDGQAESPMPDDGPTATAGATAPGDAAGVGDSRYPLQGNPGYDVGHYTIELDVDAVANILEGTTTILATATQSLPRFNLDFVGLRVTGAEVDGVAATTSRFGQELTVTRRAKATVTASVVTSATVDSDTPTEGEGDRHE